MNGDMTYYQYTVFDNSFQFIKVRSEDKYYVLAEDEFMEDVGPVMKYPSKYNNNRTEPNESEFESFHSIEEAITYAYFACDEEERLDKIYLHTDGDTKLVFQEDLHIRSYPHCELWPGDYYFSYLTNKVQHKGGNLVGL